MKRVLFIFLIISLQLCHAWGKLGHRVIGKIADDHLSTEARLYVTDLFHGKSIAQISTWLDDIKSDSNPEYKKFRTWHYIDEKKHNPKGDVITAMDYATNILSNRKNSSKQQQQEAVAILAHIVGDIHQPLHVGNGLDWGGNKCVVNWYRKGRKVSLHKVWDSYLPNSEGLSFTELASFLSNISAKEIKLWQSGTVNDWIAESRGLHAKIYPESKDNVWHSYCNASKDQPLPTLSYKYVYDNTPIMEMRMRQAGIRLAGLINKLISQY